MSSRGRIPSMIRDRETGQISNHQVDSPPWNAGPHVGLHRRIRSRPEASASWDGAAGCQNGPDRRRESVPEDLPGSMNKHAVRHSRLLMNGMVEAAVSEEAALRGHLEPDLSGGI